MKLLCLIIINVCLKYVGSDRILAIVFTPSYSHQVAFRPLWKELSGRGHEITLLTTDPMKDSKLKNIKEIDLSESYQIMEKYRASNTIMKAGVSKGNLKETIKALHMYVNALSKTANWQLEQPEVENIIKNRSEHFDLIMIEMMYPTHLGFVDRFKVPFIGVTSLDAPPRIHRAIGNFMHPVVYPDFGFSFVRNLDFFQRLKGLVYSWITQIYEYFLYKLESENVKTHFGHDIRHLNEIEKDMSMLFINANPLFHKIRPVGPTTISIGGGLHLQKVQPLPKDIQEFMDNAEEGVIYFSLGTNVKSSLINDRTKSVILQTFVDLPYRVLWKFEMDYLAEKPENVKIVKWAPQQDVLRHPKLLLFITQCGLQSIEESIYNHIPMVGMPFFGDQHSNALLLEEKNLGISVTYQNLSKETFKDAILEAIRNPFYRNQVKNIALLCEDVEMTGLEKAVWWTEYTLRTQGAKHLRNPNVNLSFYKYYLLDVMGFILSTVILLLFTVRKICKTLTKFI